MLQTSTRKNPKPFYDYQCRENRLKMAKISHVLLVLQESPLLKRSRATCDSLPMFLDPSLDAKKRSKLIEREMNEQAKIINDLRTLGASHSTIEQETKRLRELEALVFKDFRR